jgi:hypothetical protein
MEQKDINIIIINGPGRSGKDTFIKMFRECFDYKGQEIWNYSTIDDIVKMLEFYFQILENDKSIKYRNLLSEVKDSLIKYDDIPFKRCIRFLGELYKFASFRNKYFLFIHCREESEINKINNFVKNDSRFKTIKNIYLKREVSLDIECEKDKPIKGFIGKQYDSVITTKTGAHGRVDMDDLKEKAILFYNSHFSSNSYI